MYTKILRLIKVELHKIILRLCDKKDKMKNFTSVDDIDNLQNIIAKALKIKKNPLENPIKGKGKTIGLVFLNSSLRTRLSSQIAAQNLGLNVLVLNAARKLGI